MPEPAYDSRWDTLNHIERVQKLMTQVVLALVDRARDHDSSKLVDPEKSMLDRLVPELEQPSYGSPEYMRSLASDHRVKALKEHYAHNPHHPEHHPSGIAGMSLIDLIEMLCDWTAATARHADGDIHQSLPFNIKRFGIGEQLEHILLNSLEEMGW